MMKPSGNRSSSSSRTRTMCGCPCRRPEDCAPPGLAVRGAAGLALSVMSQSPHDPLPTAADVDAAAQRLAGVALRTPLVTSPVLDAMVQGRVFLKAEILQRTGSFKFPGAYNNLSSIPEREPGPRVLAFPSGNRA